jgi:hypothetical protein
MQRYTKPQPSVITPCAENQVGVSTERVITEMLLHEVLYQVVQHAASRMKNTVAAGFQWSKALNDPNGKPYLNHGIRLNDHCPFLLVRMQDLAGSRVSQEHDIVKLLHCLRGAVRGELRYSTYGYGEYSESDANAVALQSFYKRHFPDVEWVESRPRVQLIDVNTAVMPVSQSAMEIVSHVLMKAGDGICAFGYHAKRLLLSIIRTAADAETRAVLYRNLALDSDSAVRRLVKTAVRRDLEVGSRLTDSTLRVNRVDEFVPTGLRRNKQKALDALELPKLETVTEVMEFLGIKSPRQLAWFMSGGKRPEFAGVDRPYRKWAIQKRNGREREIVSPCDSLKWVQRRILEGILNRVPLSDSAHGFVRGRSIVTNAVPHVGAVAMIKADIKDFFPSIAFTRVLGLFISLGYKHPGATEVSQDGLTQIPVPRADWSVEEEGVEEGDEPIEEDEEDLDEEYDEEAGGNNAVFMGRPLTRLGEEQIRPPHPYSICEKVSETEWRVVHEDCVAMVLAALCCFRQGIRFGDASTPQGAPTSPAIANLICRKLDKRIAGYVKKMGGRYTRYADDLTISWPTDVFQERDEDRPAWDTRRRVRPGAVRWWLEELAFLEGFKLHPEKFKVFKGGRKAVTGIIVNEKINIQRETLKTLRAIIHNCKKHGIDANRREHGAKFEAWLSGMVAYVNMARPDLGRMMRADLRELGIKPQMLRPGSDSAASS